MVARVRGTSLNALIVDSLAAEVERARNDKTFTRRARQLLQRDKELLDRLATDVAIRYIGSTLSD
ncbi:MAG: hypothetical protein ACT4OX_11615 [Actinomycetota bacterium]